MRVCNQELLFVVSSSTSTRTYSGCTAAWRPRRFRTAGSSRPRRFRLCARAESHEAVLVVPAVLAGWAEKLGLLWLLSAACELSAAMKALGEAHAGAAWMHRSFMTFQKLRASA